MFSNKNKIVIIILVILIIISFSFFIIGYKNFLNPKLGSFQISKIVENDSLFYIYMTPSHNAISYKVIGLDQNNNIVFEQENDFNIFILNNLDLNYNDIITFKAEAYNKNNISKESENSYNFIYSDLTFLANSEHYTLKNKDFIINFSGDIKNQEYSLDIYYEDVLLKTIPIENDSVILDKNFLDELSGKLALKINKNGKRITDILNLYVNSPIVGNISITNFLDEAYVSWNDLVINYEGGINATSLIVNLYEKNKLVNTQQMIYPKSEILLPAELFKEETKYTLELIAIYKDYYEVAKSDSIVVNVGKKRTVSPVYVDYNYKNINANTKISLMTNTIGATIYYTLDGSEPNSNSLIYKEPLIINKDVTIKAKAIYKNMYDSVVNTYDFHIGRKDLVVYLSPSNQYENYGIKGSNYTTEKAMMNKLTDYLEKYLKLNGVKVYRNNPSGNINTWLNESNYVKSDLHLAIHSNASTLHNAHGIEMYVDNETSKSLSIANKIYNNLYSIYPYKEKYTNRGVKYSKKSLGEANDDFIPCGTLIEIAYHDYFDDAKWMVNNLETIAKNIGDSILDYYQVK